MLTEFFAGESCEHDVEYGFSSFILKRKLNNDKHIFVYTK